MKCKSNKCEKEVTCHVFWPGKTTEMCATCALRATNTATHMGFALDIRPIKPDTGDAA